MDQEQSEQVSIKEPQPDQVKKKKGFKTGILSGIFGSCVIVAAVCLVLSGMGLLHVSVGKKTEANNVLTASVESKINTLVGQINKYYYQDVKADDLANGLYKGLFEGLKDPYSAYYTKKEYDDLMVTTKANYYGIGAGLKQDPDTMKVTITHIYDKSPAKEAGLQSGDVIVQVDDITATSMEVSDLVTKIRGEEGTTVHLKIFREGEKDYRELDVKRAKVDIPTVQYKMLENNIGYIQVSEFAESTPKDFDAAIQDLKGKGMVSMIVDLRDNGGGLLAACQAMLDEILPQGTVVYTEDKYGNRKDYTSDAEHYMNIPIAVLVNGNSASASEIFAGAIRDFKYGTLIGTKTFGKGIVQNIIPLSDGGAFKVTIAKYFTPSGDYIHGKGIKPDIDLKYEYSGDANATYDQMKDNQVLKAIETLKAKMQK
jgi:carboxyl-terminal processing protease